MPGRYKGSVQDGRRDGDYPPEAYAPDGTPWWQLRTSPGSKTKFGAERKIAAWIAFNVEVGSTFSIRDVRSALGSGAVPNDDEHTNRRFRKLRERDGWIMPSNKDDRTLSVGVYRLEKVGWHPGLGTERPRDERPSRADARKVFERDGRRCVICGVGSGEPYPGEPGTAAVLTVGHRVPRDMSGGRELSNLQTECKYCNEAVRQEMGKPQDLEDVMPSVRALRKDDLRNLLAWLQQGYRQRGRVDEVFDRLRALSAEERTDAAAAVRRMLEGR